VQHSENDYHLLDWLITPAYAEAGVCLMPIPDGTTVRLSPEAVAALRQAVALAVPVLLSAGVFYFGSTVSLGDQIDQTQTLADGTVMHLTGVGDELTRRAEITLPNGQTVSLVLTLNDNGYALVSGSFAGASMSGDTLDDMAKQLASASGLQVVYNNQVGPGHNGGPPLSDEGNTGNQPNGDDGDPGGALPIATVPIGRSGNPIQVLPGTNVPANIGGIDYTGHALDEMQADGIMPSVVQNAVRNVLPVTGKVPGTTAFLDSINNITVIQSTADGNIITVSRGLIRQ
jgi:hypothetical protein